MAREPNYDSYNTRLSSFSKWSEEKTGQNPVELAKAGFVYVGTGDYTRCFYCSVKLKNWESDNEPWKEHEKWSPDCPFLKNHHRYNNNAIKDFRFLSSSRGGGGGEEERARDSGKLDYPNLHDLQYEPFAKQQQRGHSYNSSRPTENNKNCIPKKTSSLLKRNQQQQQQRPSSEQQQRQKLIEQLLEQRRVEKSDECERALTEMGYTQPNVQRAMRKLSKDDEASSFSIHDLLDVLKTYEEDEADKADNVLKDEADKAIVSYSDDDAEEKKFRLRLRLNLKNIDFLKGNITRSCCSCCCCCCEMCTRKDYYE